MAKETDIVNSHYRSVDFDPKAYAARRRVTDPAFRVAYDALEDEFTALAALLAARKAAGLTRCAASLGLQAEER